MSRTQVHVLVGERAQYFLGDTFASRATIDRRTVLKLAPASSAIVERKSVCDMSATVEFHSAN